MVIIHLIVSLSIGPKWIILGSVRSRGWVAVTKKKVNLILDLEEGDFWYNKCKRGKTAKFQKVFIWLLRSISRK
jgi:hypothetical protein